MAQFSLADLRTIKLEPPDPTLVDILNSAPAGQTPLLNEASLSRYRAALKAQGDVAKVDNPSANRLTSSDPSLDAILEKQSRLTAIENQIIEENARAFEKALATTGIDRQRDMLRGLDMALAFSPDDEALLKRKAAVQNELQSGLGQLEAIQKQLAQKTTLELFQEKNRLEKEIVQIEKLRSEGQDVAGKAFTGDKVLGELTGKLPEEARRERLQGFVSDELGRLAQGITNGTVFSIADPLVQASETTRQAFQRRALNSAPPTLVAEVKENFEEANAFIKAERQRLSTSLSTTDQNLIATGVPLDALIGVRMQQGVQAFAVDRLKRKIAQNSAWLVPDGLSQQELEIVDKISTFFDSEASDDAGVGLSRAVERYAETLDFASAGETPERIMGRLAAVVDKMTRAATLRYNATHQQLGLDVDPQVLKRDLDTIIVRLSAKAGRAGLQERGASDVFIRLTQIRREAAAGGQ